MDASWKARLGRVKAEKAVEASDCTRRGGPTSTGPDKNDKQIVRAVQAWLLAVCSGEDDTGPDLTVRAEEQRRKSVEGEQGTTQER
ncbi:hypothetical protein NDU88_003620 [Pleurodeles waltl]|uniref:Uncharacterized protein n=1 Tax=Pleurodeles waltl TaxID=8319 RepID=A0AAV7LHG5_PLEWA|nr:hypothetical protein NDU88_003620 [Pleurodeles waltl]